MNPKLRSNSCNCSVIILKENSAMIYFVTITNTLNANLFSMNSARFETVWCGEREKNKDELNFYLFKKKNRQHRHFRLVQNESKRQPTNNISKSTRMRQPSNVLLCFDTSVD